MSLASKITALQDRAHMLQKARHFFSERNILEVDTPLLSSAAPIDQHIDIMTIPLEEGQKGFLHSSPEYAMKRLIASGLTDIYQMSHVFRKGEISPLHNPEFTMVEWYKKDYTFEGIIDDTIAFIRLFLGDLKVSKICYRKALQTYAKIDYVHAKPETLMQCVKQHPLAPSSDLSSWDKDTLLQWITSFIVEPHFTGNELHVLYHFPASQAALSKTDLVGEEKVAKRFEVYYQGIELANGYSELTDAKEQRTRFIHSNQKRKEMGKEELVLDERLLQALEQGMPDCCGVAVGFDRLMMQRLQKKEIKDVIPFAWCEV